MKTIHKIEIDLATEQVLYLPAGAHFLTTQVQRNTICLWYECFPLASKTPRKIIIVGTGQELPDCKHLAYIGTVQDGGFVWHIYEDKK